MSELSGSWFYQSYVFGIVSATSVPALRPWSPPGDLEFKVVEGKISGMLKFGTKATLEITGSVTPATDGFSEGVELRAVLQFPPGGSRAIHHCGARLPC